MGNWRISSDLLARSSFTVSPWQETFGALAVLAPEPGRLLEPWERAFRAGHAEAFDAMLAEYPVRRALLPLLSRPRRPGQPGWVADFLSFAPPRVDPAFAEELASLDAWDDAAIRRELESMHARQLPSTLRGAPLLAAVRGLMEWVWTATVSADWARCRRVLEADIVSRTARLASRGWAAVIDDLTPRSRWLGSGELRINDYDLPTRDLTGARQLYFVPTTHRTGWVAWTAPTSYAVIYPVTGVLAARDDVAPGGLGRLVGQNRARLLHTLDAPRSTTQLAALTGLPVGSVGNHLRVLLDAGMVQRSRSGREVRYWRTSLGEALCAGDEGPDRARGGRSRSGERDRV